MKTHSRLCRVTLLFFSHSILILTLTAIVAAQTPNPIDGCDATLKAKLKFKELRTQFIKDRTSVDKSEFRRAARNYIRLAEQCYELTVGESAVGQRIDEGGLWMGPSGASVTSPRSPRTLCSSAQNGARDRPSLVVLTYRDRDYQEAWSPTALWRTGSTWLRTLARSETTLPSPVWAPLLRAF